MYNPVRKLVSFYAWLTAPSDINVALFLLKSASYHLRSKQIFAHHNTVIKGLSNIEINGRLVIGKADIPLLNGLDRTFLSIRGKLIINGYVHIGKGCRLDIAHGAVCVLEDCSFTGMSNLIVNHRLEIGAGTNVSWGCEFLDEDLHEIHYEGRKAKPNEITIGNHVWIGSYARILKGVRIESGSVVASSAVVTRSFPENVLIAGNPARVVRENVTWTA